MHARRGLTTRTPAVLPAFIVYGLYTTSNPFEVIIQMYMHVYNYIPVHGIHVHVNVEIIIIIVKHSTYQSHCVGTLKLFHYNSIIVTSSQGRAG